MMKSFLSVIVAPALFGVGAGTLILVAEPQKPQPQQQQEKPEQAGQQPQQNVQQPQGRVLTKPSGQLHRHPNPVPQPPPHHRPPPRPNHRWHWSPVYAKYILLPVNVAPRQIVLPPTYQLPQGNVTYYDAPLTVESGCTCPVCGAKLILQPG